MILQRILTTEKQQRLYASLEEAIRREIPSLSATKTDDLIRHLTSSTCGVEKLTDLRLMKEKHLTPVLSVVHARTLVAAWRSCSGECISVK